MLLCDRCQKQPATRHQEWRQAGHEPHWPNETSDRCDRCADALVEHAAVMNMRVESWLILVDEPIPATSASPTPGYRDTLRESR